MEVVSTRFLYIVGEWGLRSDGGADEEQGDCFHYSHRLC